MFILIDKPKGVTSHEVVDRIRTISGERRVGHAGTLDPNATGLLIVGIGRESTKKLGGLSKDTKKTYEAEIFLGEERDTDDALGKIQSSKFKVQNYISKFKVNKSQIQKLLTLFIGEQEQVPPKYSAIKVKGQPAYKRARKGQEFELKPRKIVIYSIKLLSYEFPILKIQSQVSSGTYIRALARDIGKELGCGAYLKNLRRLKIGKYDITKAIKPDNLIRDNWLEFVIEL